MNYSLIKTIIETSISQYVCQSCSQKIDENSINIVKIGEGSLDFHVICPHCRTEAQMHAEIGTAQVNMTQTENMTPGTGIIKNTNAIKESDIAIIEKNLTEKNSIEDLLK